MDSLQLVYNFLDVVFPYFALVIFYSATHKVCNVVKEKTETSISNTEMLEHELINVVGELQNIEMSLRGVK